MSQPTTPRRHHGNGSTMSSPRRDNSILITTPRRNESFRSMNGTLNRSSTSNQSGLSIVSGRNPANSYATLRDRALSRRVLFEDPHFPATDSSLKINYQNLIDDIEWRRPHELSRRPSFITKDPGLFEVVPGVLGSSWLLPAFSSLTLAPTVVQKCLPDEQAFDENYAGIFRFRFWRFGEWIEIHIDDRLPTHNGKLLFLKNADPNEFWIALFEKAYAKLYGSYAAIQGTRIHWVLQDLTGGITDCCVFNNNNNNNNSKSLLQKIVDSSMERCSLLSATITNQGNVPRQLPNGLVTGRAYNITGYAEYTDNGNSAIMIRLRNPWVKPDWVGPWNDRSPNWLTVSDTMKEKLGCGQLKAGEFWMPFEEFAVLFTSLELCHLPPEAWFMDTKLRHRLAWKSVVAHRQWRRGFNAGGSKQSTVSYNSQFYIELPKQSNIVLSLMQKYRLLGEVKEFVPCGCLIYKAPQDRKTRLQANHFSPSCHVASTGIQRDRDIVRFFTLPAGSYVIVPVTEASGIEGKFLLRIFSDEKATVIRELDDPDTATYIQLDNRLDPGSGIALRRRFLMFCNRYEEIDGYGLREILSYKPKTPTTSKLCCNVQQDDSDIQRVFLSPETCKAAITIVDKDMNGRLTYDEFMSLVQRLSLWQSIFKKYAVSNGSVMDSYNLRNAFRIAGFSVSNKILEALVLRFAAKDFMNLEGFVNSVVKLHVSHQTFLLHILQGNQQRFGVLRRTDQPRRPKAFEVDQSASERQTVVGSQVNNESQGGDRHVARITDVDQQKSKKYLQDLLRTAIYS